MKPTLFKRPTRAINRPEQWVRARKGTKQFHAVQNLLKRLDTESVQVGTHPPRKRPDVS